MRIFIFHLGCFLILIMASSVATARTLRVPADCPSIQYAINAGATGDTVLVSPGVYNESVNFAGKGIYLASVAGPTATRIEPPANSAAVYFDNGENSNAVLSGFTLTNAGAGISVASSSPTIWSNVIVNCGNGINVLSGSPVIEKNRFTGCLYYGTAAVNLTGVCGAAIRSNLIQSNYSGGIIMSAMFGTILIANNSIQGNQGTAIGAFNYYFNGSVFYSANIIQNVIADNSGAAIYCWVNPGSRGPVLVNNTL
ncbi:MAG: NosD domain-containing protein, partial [Negativicutes bacterium]|nr:NosD domain-containing protein [Negativicutes bacterium]